MTADDDAPRLFTGRLELVAATAELARAAAESAAALAARLECEVPRDWPPDGVKKRQQAWAAALASDPSLTGWCAWYVVQVRPPMLVGSIAFSGAPDADGTVECAYTMLPKWQKKGYATEALGALIDWSFSQGARRIRAHARRNDAASIRVLEKNGLSRIAHAAAATDAALLFELARPD